MATRTYQGDPSMSSPAELLKNRPFEVFGAEEINELLLMIYVQLQIALRHNSDVLVLNTEELKHVTDDVVVERFTMPFGNISIYSAARQNLLQIFERDDLVKQYFQLDHADDDNLVVRTIKSRKLTEGLPTQHI
jgi:hypothetical protein